MTDGKNTERRTHVSPRGGKSEFVVLLIVVLIVAGVVVLLMPAVRSGPSQNRVRCFENLRNIGLAIHHYRDKYGCYPPAYIVDKQEQRMHSWRALLLEFLDTNLYHKYDFSRPWNSPGNLAVARMLKDDRPYHCPTEGRDNPTWTSYVMLAGPTAFGNASIGHKPEEITDGSAHTLAVVEMSPSGILWTAPYDLNVSEMSFKINDAKGVGPRSCHHGGANVLFVDCDVRFICSDNEDIEKIMKGLATINGGENVKFPD
jgi:hypothetical protein